MQKLQEEFADDGLMVLALSDEEDEKVEEYVQNMNLTIRVAAGHKSTGAFAVGRGIPRTYLIGADGKVLWAGHPSSLSSGKVKDALKGVKASGSYLGFKPKGEYSEKSIAKLAGMVQQAKLGKAMSSATKLSEKEGGGAEAMQAKELIGEINAHAAMLIQQAESFIAKKEVLIGASVLESLEGEFKGFAIEGTARARLEEIAKDESLKAEWEADKALAKLAEKAAKKGWRKQLKKLESLAKKHEGTNAARKAKKIIRTENS